MFQVKPAHLTVTSQPSRFHTESQHLLRTVHIKDLNISVGENSLLVDAELQLVPSTHYGLIGRNGVGKSCLLKCLANGWIPGLPSDLSILYVEQMETEAQLCSSVLDLLLNANPRHARI